MDPKEKRRLELEAKRKRVEEMRARRAQGNAKEAAPGSPAPAVVTLILPPGSSTFGFLVTDLFVFRSQPSPTSPPSLTL